MDDRERYESAQLAVKSAIQGNQSSVWTALPGIITSYDADTITAQVQPALHSLYTGPDQTKEWKVMPVIPDVPVIFPRGGKYALTFPVQRGDECLIVFSSRCIDNWWQQGGVQTQRELRMHDLSDGFAIPGPWSQATKISNLSTTTAQLRTSDGSIYAEVDNDNEKVRLVVKGITIEADAQNNVVNITGASSVTVTANNSATVTAPTVTVNSASLMTINCPLVKINGNLQITGTVTGGFGTADQVGLSTHRHGVAGVPAAAQTIPPTPGT
jgi:phage baseplate assembly protein gpV